MRWDILWSDTAPPIEAVVKSVINSFSFSMPHFRSPLGIPRMLLRYCNIIVLYQRRNESTIMVANVNVF